MRDRELAAVRPRSRLLGLPRRLFQAVFRMVPYPTPPRLVRLGSPGRAAPVLVTTNCDLTVRRVCGSLAGLDAWLLVAPAGGLDVWCAAVGGVFSIDGIVSILKTSRIAGKVDHRCLVLPQLAAAGINLVELRQRTGWTGVFGPVEAARLPEFLRTGRCDGSARRVRFGVRERIEMAVALWGSLSLRFTVFPVLVGGLRAALPFVALVALFAGLLSLGCFRIPGRGFLRKAGLAFGLPALVAIPGADLALHGVPGAGSLGWLALTWFAAYLVGSAFASYTPLWQCGYSRLFYGLGARGPRVVEEACSGCGRCLDACPLGCFARGPAGEIRLARPDRCAGCGACRVQCPADAIQDGAPLGCAAPAAAA